MTPQYYPIETGKLYGGEYPGHPQPDVAKVRLSHLVSLGIRTFVDLTAPADRMIPYEGLLTELEEEAGGPLRARSANHEPSAARRRPPRRHSARTARRCCDASQGRHTIEMIQAIMDSHRAGGATVSLSLAGRGHPFADRR